MRGRWVVLLVIFIFQFSIVNSVFTPKIFAQEKNIFVTVTVEPSKEWQEAISQYSQVTLETQSPELLKPIKISVLSKGLLDQTIPNQKIRITVVDDTNSTQEATLFSRQDGTTGYAFVPTHYGNYLIQAENISYKKSIALSPLQFSIQKKESLLDLVLKLFQEKI